MSNKKEATTGSPAAEPSSYIFVPLTPERKAELTDRARRNSRSIGREGAAIILAELDRDKKERAK